MQKDEGNISETTRLTETFRQVKSNFPLAWFSKTFNRFRIDLARHLDPSEKTQIDRYLAQDEKEEPIRVNSLFELPPHWILRTQLIGI